MLLQCPKGRHRPDGKLRFGLFDPVKPQPAKVNGRADAGVPQPQPQHAPKNPTALILIQLPRLFQAPGANIVLYGYHIPCSCSTSFALFLLILYQ